MFLQNLRTIFQVIDSALYKDFWMLPVIGGLVGAFFLVFIIFTSIKTKILFEFLGDFIVAWNKGVVAEGKFRRSWREIQKNMSLPDELSWHKGLIAADDILGEIIETMGYAGTTMDERLQRIDPAHFPYVSEAAAAHKVRQYFDQDPNYRISREAAEKTFAIYKKIFEELGVI